MSDYKVDASDPGKCAQIVWSAAVLSARVAGMQAANIERERNGYALAYGDSAFEECVQDARAALGGSDAD